MRFEPSELAGGKGTSKKRYRALSRGSDVPSQFCPPSAPPAITASVYTKAAYLKSVRPSSSIVRPRMHAVADNARGATDVPPTLRVCAPPAIKRKIVPALPVDYAGRNGAGCPPTNNFPPEQTSEEASMHRRNCNVEASAFRRFISDIIEEPG